MVLRVLWPRCRPPLPSFLPPMPRKKKIMESNRHAHEPQAKPKPYVPKEASRPERWKALRAWTKMALPGKRGRYVR